MADKTILTLYEEVVQATYDYLGPAADRFVARQIKSHLDKDPEDLQKEDLQDLIVWINLAMNLLVDDQRLVDYYIADLRNLAKGANK
jgi:hypothetical protein